MKRLLAFSFALIAVLAAGFLATASVHAQVNSGFLGIDQTINLPSTDPRVIAARIINVALGVVGIVLIAIILYAGFMYMTSGGDAKKTQTALAWIRNAIIGLIIILMSWAFARFVIDRLLQAVGPGGGQQGGGPGGGGPGGGFGGGGGNQPFAVVSITPQGAVGTKKVIVKIIFNQPVLDTSAQTPGNIIVEKLDGTVVPGDITVENRVVRFTPGQPCPAPNQTRRCLEDNTDYRVRVSPSLQSTGGQTLTCGGFSPACDGTFRSGVDVDLTPPTVFITNPLDGQPVSADALIDVGANASDEVGISYISFTANGGLIAPSAPAGATPRVYQGGVQWDTIGLAPGTQQTLLATAYDVDSSSAQSQPVNVIIRAATCFNGVQDPTETGIDCGGAAGDPNACGACSGGVCTVNSDCSSGVCSNGRCVEQPIITSVTPADGAVGSYVTIRGVNFGSSGQVRFLGAAGSPGVIAIPPQACTTAGAQTWTPTQVVVEVPAGAQTGALQLTNAGSGLNDTTNALPAPALPDFLVNNTLRPGICAAVPSAGPPGQLFRLVGTAFGNTASGILFGTRVLTSSSWTDSAVEALIPTVNVGPYPVSVSVGGIVSNPVQMQVTPRTGGGTPEIVSIDPAAGPVGTYVTIRGLNFGSGVGQVFFRDVATGNEALADTNFPPACTGVYWSSSSIVVKVPPAFTRGSTGALVPGTYAVRVMSASAGTPASNEVNFSVNTQPAAPGICRVTPDVAPAGTAVVITGERLTGGPGTVTFYQNRNGTASSWSDTQIASVIPTAAQTGPLTVTPASNGLTSNGFLVQVRNCNEVPDSCASGDECCSDGSCRASGSCAAVAQNAMFAWRTSTGLIPRAPRVVEECRAGEIPSPSPWDGRAGGNDACVNSTVVVRFTTQIDPASVAASTNAIQLFACTGSGTDPCVTKQPVPFANGSPRVSAANATQDIVTLQAQSALQPLTTFEVVLTTGVRGGGAAGANMGENAARCGAGNAYCFRFRTRGDTNPCAIGSVEVAPDPYTVSQQGPLPVDHIAIPLAQNDACTVLQCEAYDWTWSTSDGRASVTNNPDLSRTPPLGACVQRATAQLETGTNPVLINATASGVTGSGDLYVRFVPPKVERYGPNCQDACINAAAWAVFTAELDPASVNSNNVQVQRCWTESCLDLDPPLAIPASNIQLVPAAGSSDARLRQITILPMVGSQALFLPGRFYKVTLVGGTLTGIRSTLGVPISGLNDPAGFAWTFRVRPGDQGICTVDRVTVAPGEKYETIVGARQAFTATPFSAPDSCSEQGQQLVAMGGYAWSSSAPNVATLLQNGQVDTGAILPASCSGRCLFQGSAGRAGLTARCGDGIVQTTNIRTCVGGVTILGTPCTVLAAGGKGGEECDDANTNGNDGCSNSCLFNPIQPLSAGGTCGNGVRNPGEDCDPGRACQGVSATSTMQNGADCTSLAAEGQCLSNGGTCAPRMFRGCSPTCRNLGSIAGGSTCGNGDVADGEDCDDGNTASGDGCNASCLNEGSSQLAVALCGNGVMEAGEACERQGSGGVWPVPGCDPGSCLRTGVVPCAVPGGTACCGNGNSNEAGKECDDGNIQPGDGCSATCKLEGSSPAYLVPSFCGNGILEMGEQCEAPGPAFAGDSTASVPGGDGSVDPVQVAEIVGQGQTDNQGRMSSTLSSQLTQQNRTGTAIYGLQCGFTDERQCSTDFASYDPQTGLSSSGCCSARPALVPGSAFPPNGSGETAGGPFPQGVCRNVLISGTFAQNMDTQSMEANFIVAKRISASACPSDLRDVTVNTPIEKGWRGFFARIWRSVIAFFRPAPAIAQRWCAGTVTGRLDTVAADNGTTFAFTLDTALEPNTDYRVRFLGDTSDAVNPLADNADPAKRLGIRTKQGVVAIPDLSDNGAYTWHFRTGTIICQVNDISLRDLTQRTPYLFTAAGERHPFTAVARSLQGGVPVPLSPTTDYAWEWQNWVMSNPSLATIDPAGYATPAQRASAATSKDIISKSVNGASYLSARVRVSADTVNIPSSVGRVTQGTARLTFNLCENPWPSKATAPFRDALGSPSLEGTPFENGPYFNFSMSYCRDAGVSGANEDLPGLIPSGAAPNSADVAQGILRQYFFTFREPALQKDGIGVRIAANPLHLSPLEWYRAKGFTGNPQPLTVDGYEAIRDGRTVYISAVNTLGPDGTGASQDLYSNIYLISYNEGADQLTQRVYDELLKSFSFNDNIQVDVANACQDSAGSLVSGSDGLAVNCSADWECDKFGDGLRCANFKGKLQRDLVRLGNFQELSRSLAQTKASSGKYPSLGAGSYLPMISTSRWPSWDDAFRSALGGGEVPDDPVNRFVTCGRCNPGNTACVTDSDCGGTGTCVAQQGYDPATCWNETSKQFICPSDGQGSRVYQYRGLPGGERFELSAEFEVPPPDPLNPGSRWWKPAPPTQELRCTAGLTGAFCATDADCRVCPSGNCTGVATVAGACRLAGGTYRYTDICRGTALGTSGSCGDGVVDSVSTACLSGSRDGQACSVASDCPGGACAAKEICELTGPSATVPASCVATGNQPGQKQQRCLECRRYADDTAQPGCFAISQCGNGRVDAAEACDDGVANGQYGRCNATCTGFGAYCGDSQISPGEICDLGTGNGALCTSSASSCRQNSCNVTCSGPAPYCGDSSVDAGEACDGNTETRVGSCAPGRACDSTDPAFRGVGCTANSQCGTGGRCLSGNVPYVQTRTCDMSGSNRCTQFNSWSACAPQIFCGNGQVDGSEECDDGNSLNEDACTNSCKRNVCGDGRLFLNVEECDAGTANGTACTSGEYGATCSSCSTSCKFQLTQGGYCGDGIKTAGSPEQCDMSDFGPGVNPASISCRSLGYDYLSSGLSALQCSTTCQYSGCAYCGDTPGNGQFSGYLWDTLFQQPVPNARVALFYRGLQVQAVTSDDTGYFAFSSLDRTTGCDQYRVVIDSYDDNPLTPSFNESKRGGYQAVRVGPFRTDRTDQDDSGEFNRAVTDNFLGINWRPPGTSNNLVRINMLPRLNDDEYVVQFWWDPIPGDANGYQNTINAYQNAVQNEGMEPPLNYLNSQLSNYHDLMVRTPFMYEPGTFGSCSLNPRPETFGNDRGDLCTNAADGTNFDALCRSVDYTAGGRDFSAEMEFLDSGMVSCTNKIRATAQGTCVTSNGVQTNQGCDGDWECVSPFLHNMGVGATCACNGPSCSTKRSAPEPSRSGPLQVLDGRPGAYLFCFHPEYTDPAARVNSDCRNFLVPPQSTFITGQSGQYDVIISQYLMFGSGAYGPQRVSEWLYDHNAKVDLYDKNGLYKRWDYRAIAPRVASWPPEWEGGSVCPNDPTPGNSQTVATGGVGAGIRGAVSYPTDAGWPDAQFPALKMTYAGGVNQYWVPFSIDTTNRAVKEWNSDGWEANGVHHAAFHSFADTYWSGGPWNMAPGTGECWYHTSSNFNSTDSQGNPVAWPPSGQYLCSDGAAINAAARYSGSPSDPPCDTTSRDACRAAFAGVSPQPRCAGTVSSSVRCVQFCNMTATDKRSVCTGDVAGTSGNGRIEAFCGGPYTMFNSGASYGR